jgi:hypothetical protein
LVSAKEEIDAAGRDVAYDWEGKAAEQYGEYLKNMTKSTDQFITISAGVDQTTGGIAKGMLDIWNAIVDEYQALHDAILDLGRIILETAGMIAGKIASAGEAILGGGNALKAALAAVGLAEPIANAFAKLITAYKEFVNKIVDANQSVHSALTGISSAAQRLTVSEPSPKEGEKKYWKPAGDSGSGN